MNNSSKVFWIWLSMSIGVGNKRIWAIMADFDNIETAFMMLKSGEYSAVSEKEKKAIQGTHLQQAQLIIEYCNKNNINIVTYEEDNYPSNLKNIYNPPPILFYKGDMALTEETVGITVVGTRIPSNYSIDIAKRFCSDLSKVGVTIISGFAMGLDSVAHETAIENNGKTITVLGCGIDVDYPKGHNSLKESIEKNGLVITEFLPGTKPLPSNFPQRNRIMSALGMGTLIIEASARSGSLITAELAIEQGKEVFCIPPSNLFEPRYAGVIKFLRDGAIPVFSYLDIIYEYYRVFTHKLSAISNPYEVYSDKNKDTLIFGNSNNQKSEKTENNIANESNGKTNNKLDKDQELQVLSSGYDESDFTEEQNMVIKLLADHNEKHADEIAIGLNMNISTLFAILTELEIDGIVTAMAGKVYKLSAR